MSPSPAHPQTTSLSATSPQFLNTSRDGDSSLCSLCHCLATLQKKKLLLTPNPNLFWHNIRPSPLVLWPLPSTAADPRIPTISFQGTVASDEVSPEPPLPQRAPGSVRVSPGTRPQPRTPANPPACPQPGAEGTARPRGPLAAPLRNAGGPAQPRSGTAGLPQSSLGRGRTGGGPRAGQGRAGRPAHRLIRSRQAELGRSLSQSPLTVGSQKAECVRSAAPAAAAAAAAMGAPPLPGATLAAAGEEPKPAAAHSSAGMKTPGLPAPPPELAEVPPPPLPAAASTAAGAASSAAGLSAIPRPASENAASGTPHQRVGRPERPPPRASSTDHRPERHLPRAALPLPAPTPPSCHRVSFRYQSGPSTETALSPTGPPGCAQLRNSAPCCGGGLLRTAEAEKPDSWKWEFFEAQ